MFMDVFTYVYTHTCTHTHTHSLSLANANTQSYKSILCSHKHINQYIVCPAYPCGVQWHVQ